MSKEIIGAKYNEATTNPIEFFACDWIWTKIFKAHIYKG